MPHADDFATRDAHEVVTNPDRYVDRPALRRLAWAALLSARGLRANQFRLIAMQREASPGAAQ